MAQHSTPKKMPMFNIVIHIARALLDSEGEAGRAVWEAEGKQGETDKRDRARQQNTQNTFSLQSVNGTAQP